MSEKNYELSFEDIPRALQWVQKNLPEKCSQLCTSFANDPEVLKKYSHGEAIIQVFCIDVLIQKSYEYKCRRVAMSKAAQDDIKKLLKKTTKKAVAQRMILEPSEFYHRIVNCIFDNEMETSDVEED